MHIFEATTAHSSQEYRQKVEITLEKNVQMQ